MDLFVATMLACLVAGVALQYGAAHCDDIRRGICQAQKLDRE